MKHLFVPFVLLWVQVLCAQNETRVNVLEYEIRRWESLSQQYFDNTLTIYHRGSEVYAFLSNSRFEKHYISFTPMRVCSRVFVWPRIGKWHS